MPNARFIMIRNFLTLVEAQGNDKNIFLF